MKKIQRGRIAKIRKRSDDEWLPIERWLLPHFRFTHVHGIARIFLYTEIVLTSLIVLGTLIAALLAIIS